MSIGDIDSSTDVTTYPANVANVASFLGEDDFTSWTAHQKQVDGLDEAGAACTECAPFTTYWDFLSAVAKAPGFCAGVPGASYGRHPDAAMCAKEFAGVAAVMITQTNGMDETLVDDAGVTVPFTQQGLMYTSDPQCDVAVGGDLSSDFCMAMGADSTSYPAFYDDKGLDSTGETFVPRGAGYIYGADQYYWFSKIVYGDSTITDTPSLVNTDVQAWWLSGLMRWMIPMEGKPAPHNIILGQWEPTDDEAEYGITDGFGAVSALFYGEDQCGMAGHPIARLRTEIYEGLIADFEAKDGSWKASDTVFDWESNDCASSARAEFPYWGDYSSFAQFATPAANIMDWDTGSAELVHSDTCFVVEERTEFIVWQKDAFRNCILANMATVSAPP